MIKIRNFPLTYREDIKMTLEHNIPLKPLEEGDKIPLVSDSMFKTMIQSEERIQYSCYLISLIVEKSYEELLDHLRLKTNELSKTYEGEIGSRCDYIAEIEDTILNIELNNNPSLEITERNIQYAFRNWNEQKSNHKKKQVIQINLNNYSIVGEDDTVEINGITGMKGRLLTDKLIFIQIYIPNIQKKMYTNGIGSLNELERCILSMATPNIKLSKKIGKGIDILEQYIDDAKKASGEDDLLCSYDKEQALKDMYKDEWLQQGIQLGKEQGIQQGIQLGKEQGIQQGSLKSKEEVALNMLKEKMEISLISKITGLSEQKIENLNQ